MCFLKLSCNTKNCTYIEDFRDRFRIKLNIAQEKNENTGKSDTQTPDLKIQKERDSNHIMSRNDTSNFFRRTVYSRAWYCRI